MKTLLLIDNQDITREGMKTVAGRIGGFAAIKEAGSQSELTGLLVDNPNAVAVLDYTLFDTSAEYLLILQERFKEAHFVLFSDNLSEDFIRRMVFSGTSFSVVMKDAPMIEIEEGLRKAKQHLQYMCTRAVWLLQHKEDKKDKLVSPLTVTEREILKLMALGKTTKEIAAERFLSVYTVMTHRKNIFRKLEVNNVHEATKYALRAGIVDVLEYYIKDKVISLLATQISAFLSYSTPNCPGAIPCKGTWLWIRNKLSSRVNIPFMKVSVCRILKETSAEGAPFHKSSVMK